MTPTSEQISIVKCTTQDNSLVLVKAFAGTGKTTTLTEFANERPNKRMLYVSFNKSVQTLAAKKFPGNVVCKTAHSLAWPSHGAKHASRLVPSLKANAVMRALDLKEHEIAKFTIDTLVNYLVSADAKVSKRHVPFVVKHSRYEKFDYVQYANDLGRLMCNGNNPDIGMLHDGYLKLYQLSRPKLNFDFILCDEAQDLSPVQAAIFLGQFNTPVILVGDEHQAIYQFRGAVNSMAMVNPTQTFYLTKSFRFNQHIATVANMLLESFKEEPKKIEGVNGHQCSKTDGQRAYIARTNASLFRKATTLYKNKRIGFVGGIQGYRFDRIVDVYHLSCNSFDQIKDPYIRSFDGYDAMREYAKAAEDFELSSMAGVVDEFKSMVPVLVPRIKRAAEQDLSQCDTVLTTAHKSKGLEFPNCKLLDDFASLVEENEIVDAGVLDDAEVNLIYVACTRAMNNLILSKESSLAKFIELYLATSRKTRVG